MGFPLPGDVQRFGWIGVDLFFVLSGYLIGGQLLSQLARSSSIKLGRFFARRALRILPAYLAILAIYILLPSWREYREISPIWKFLVSVQNIGLRGGTAFSHAWSLAVEDQFYLLLPFILLFLNRSRRLAIVFPCFIFLGGFALRAGVALHYATEEGIPFRAFQTWIYYATWMRLDPLLFGVVLAALEKFRPRSWERLMNFGTWIWLPGLALVAFSLYLGDSDTDTVAAAIWEFPLVALGMASLLICALSPRLPLHRVAVPGAAFIASIAYSAYLIQKLVIHAAAEFCKTHGINPTSTAALIAVPLCVCAAGTLLFFAVERPFLLLRHRLVSRG